MKRILNYRSVLLMCLLSIVSFAYVTDVRAAAPGPTFDYPQSGQTLDYAGAFLFKVQPVVGSQGYLWGFYQNDVLIWENLRDEGHLSSNEYGIGTGTTAHRKIAVGDVQVWVRALVNGSWTDATTITIHLKYMIPALILAYYPPDPNNLTYLDPNETGWTNTSISSMQTATQGMIDAGQELINNASRYHGYKDQGAPQYLEYYTYKKIEYFYAMPRGYPLGGIQYRPNYNQILKNINICDYVDNHNVKEVWIYGYHASVIIPDESKMSSKYGDVSNAYPKDEYIPAMYRLPRCTNSYVMYNFTYQPGGGQAIGNTIHNRMHQIENVVFYAENLGYPPDNNNILGSLFWNDFSVYGDRASLQGYKASCGNTHSPPNTTSGYDYTSTQYQQNNCETWNPDDSLTTYVSANCDQWGCTDVGFYSWFMQNLPGYKNGIVYKGKQMRNWWEAMYDFNAFIDAGRSLYIPKPITRTFTSVDAKDGWVLESGENTNLGGTINNNALTFRLGDNAAKKQYRGILSFNTGAGLPDTAIITSVILKVKRDAVAGGGDPVTNFQGFIVDINNGFFGTADTLQTNDFQANASKSYGPFKPAPISGWYTIDLTNAKNYVNKLTAGAGLTQIRMRFKLDDDNNAVVNYLSLFSGNAQVTLRPQLIITYYIP